MVVRVDLQLWVQVEIEEDDPSKRSRCMAGRDRFERIINLVLVARTHLPIAHDASERIASHGAADLDSRFADIEEVRTHPPISHLRKTWKTADVIRL